MGIMSIRIPRPLWILFGALIVLYSLWSIDNVRTTSISSTTLRLALPLALAAMVGIMCERSGVINIGIEGTMLISAFMAFFAGAVTQSLWIGVLTGVSVGALAGLLLALSAVTWRMDQIIAGTIINILATGLTSFLFRQGRQLPGSTPLLEIPILSEIPYLGRVLFRNPPITYAGLIIIITLWVALFHSAWGLRTRAVGEHPGSADTAGISVVRMRYLNVILAGAIGGLAGSYLTLEATGSFERGFTAGKGFTALALMIFGRWNPLGALSAALFFGLAQATANQLMIDDVIEIPQQFINMLPYVLTIVVLAVSAGKVRPPAAAGKPYSKEQA
jgi:general nucleoside transport system permease protein